MTTCEPAGGSAVAVEAENGRCWVKKVMVMVDGLEKPKLVKVGSVSVGKCRSVARPC